MGSDPPSSQWVWYGFRFFNSEMAATAMGSDPMGPDPGFRNDTDPMGRVEFWRCGVC